MKKKISPRMSARLNILIALAVALAILVSSYLLKGTGYADTAMFILIAIWFVPFSYLSGMGKQPDCR